MDKLGVELVDSCVPRMRIPSESRPVHRQVIG